MKKNWTKTSALSALGEMVIDHALRLISFGGKSTNGKSSAADYLVKHYGYMVV